MLCIQCKKRAHFYSFACGHPVFSALFIEETIVFPLSILDTFFKRSISFYVWAPWASQVALVVKNPTANTGDVRDMGLIPALGRSPGGGHDNPLQYSCLENPMDRGAWWASFHGVVKSWTWLNNFPFTFHFHALEKEMATHFSVLAWRIPGMG